MTDSFDKLSRHYLAALRNYLAKRNERALHRAYELGRKIMADGFGIVEMARIHADALSVVLPGYDISSEGVRAAEIAGAFFRESLSPFEMSHRGFQDANLTLHQLNETLADRNRQFVTANIRLKKEVTDRRRAETKLRESEKHHRTLFSEARVMQENLRYLSNQVLKVQEEERKRISRELHDEVGQALTAVNVNLAVLSKAAGAGRKSFQKKLADSQNLLEQTMEIVHSFSRELRPAMLDDLGLIPALRSFTKNFAQRTGMQVSFKACAAVERMDIDQKTVLFRVAQESLTNVSRHAHASQGKVLIQKYKNGIRMEIADNGRSFQVKRYFSSRGQKRLGLLGMQERVRLAGGHFRIASAPGKGTCVRVWVPVRRNGPVVGLI